MSRGVVNFGKHMHRLIWTSRVKRPTVELIISYFSWDESAWSELYIFRPPLAKVPIRANDNKMMDIFSTGIYMIRSLSFKCYCWALSGSDKSKAILISVIKYLNFVLIYSVKAN